MPKIDKIEYQRRLFAIQGWICEGISAGLIVRQIINSGWTNAKKEKDQKRSAERMLAVARKDWTEMEEATLLQKKKMRIARLERIGQKLDEKFKSTPAGVFAQVAVEKEIIKIEGTQAASKVEVSGKNGGPIKTETTVRTFNANLNLHG